MENREITTVDDSFVWKTSLLNAGFITLSEVFLCSPRQLGRRTRLEPGQVDEMLDALAKISWVEPVSISHILQQSSLVELFTTGDDGLDQLLGGGIHQGIITEISGQSSAGKTQLCLQLTLTVQLPLELGGLAGGAIYISSEGKFYSNRLMELAQSLLERSPSSHEDPAQPADFANFTDNIHLIKALEVEALESIVQFHIPTLVQKLESDPTRLPIRLIVIDSIAAPFRASDNISLSYIERAKVYYRLSQTLKRLAGVYNLAVVITNQVSDRGWDAGSENSSVHEDEASGINVLDLGAKVQLPWVTSAAGLGVQSSLGYAWSTCIDTRLFLSRLRKRQATQDSQEESEDGSLDGILDNSRVGIRRANLVYSADAPRAEILYTVQPSGLVTHGNITIH